MTTSRYRKIHCLIWNDDKFPHMGDYGKLVFLHLLTTTFSTPFGCFKAGKASLLEESRMDPEGFAKGFAEGYAKGLFEYDENTLTIFLPGFLKHNPPANPNVVQMWSKVFKELPKSYLKDKAYFSIKHCCEGLGEGFAKRFHKTFEKPTRKQEQEQYQEQILPIQGRSSIKGGGPYPPDADTMQGASDEQCSEHATGINGHHPDSSAQEGIVLGNDGQYWDLATGEMVETPFG